MTVKEGDFSGWNKDFREEDGHHVHARGLLPVLARLAVQAGYSVLMHGFMLHKKDLEKWEAPAGCRGSV